MSLKVHQLLSSSNFLKHIPVVLKSYWWRHSKRFFKKYIKTTTKNTRWHHGNNKQQQSELERHVSDQHFAITEFEFHCVAVFYFIFYLITGALERSTFSSGDWDSKEGFLLLGTNYDTAWFYELSLQHPPTLWARSEGSSVSIGDLHCTLKKGQIHTTTEKEYHVFHRVFFFLFFFPLLTSGMQFVYNTSVNLTKKKHRYTSQDCQRLTGGCNKNIKGYLLSKMIKAQHFPPSATTSCETSCRSFIRKNKRAVHTWISCTFLSMHGGMLTTQVSISLFFFVAWIIGQKYINTTGFLRFRLPVLLQQNLRCKVWDDTAKIRYIYIYCTVCHQWTMQSKIKNIDLNIQPFFFFLLIQKKNHQSIQKNKNQSILEARVRSTSTTKAFHMLIIIIIIIIITGHWRSDQQKPKHATLELCSFLSNKWHFLGENKTRQWHFSMSDIQIFFVCFFKKTPHP